MIPAGLPTWTRTATIEYYGGHPNKQNHMGLGAVDARTDVTAEQICRLSADLAACVRTAPFAVITLQCNDSSPGPPQVHVVRMQTGVTGAYTGGSPPSGFPTFSRTSNGRVLCTFPTSPIDDFGETIPVDIKGGMGGLKGVEGDVWVDPSNPNADAYYEAVDVKATDENGAAISNAYLTFEVW